MTQAERGVLLLCCQLGQQQAKPLTMARFRELSKLAQTAGIGTEDPLRDLHTSDLLRLGYDAAQAEQIICLLSRQEQLDAYLLAAKKRGIYPITRISRGYPYAMAKKLGMSCPPVLFCRGDAALLQTRAIAVVGSRELHLRGEQFAKTAGRLIAEAGMTLVSGGARGADRVAQEACLQAGGRVIVFTPGSLCECSEDPRILYVAEAAFDAAFSTLRAMSRNRLIHVMGEKTLVAQTGYEKGGTWGGSVENLRYGYSPLFVCDDGSEGARALICRGAVGVTELKRLEDLQEIQLHF